MINILLVCTGNICRSPFAEHLMTALLDSNRFSITSAGVAAVEGGTMPEPINEIAQRFGITTHHQHRGTSLSVEQIAQADLVLGMDREHRREIVELHPPAVKYTYTLIEFVHIATHLTQYDLQIFRAVAKSSEHGALNAVSRLRGSVPPLLPASGFDVIDPYRKSLEIYERTCAKIALAVTGLAELFRRPASQ